MKNIILTSLTSLLFLSFNVYADPHFDEAIKHATAAGGAGDAAKVKEHVLPALEHTMAGALNAKGVSKTHADAAVKALETALDQAKNNKADDAMASAKSATEHLSAANKK